MVDGLSISLSRDGIRAVQEAELLAGRVMDPFSRLTDSVLPVRIAGHLDVPGTGGAVVGVAPLGLAGVGPTPAPAGERDRGGRDVARLEAKLEELAERVEAAVRGQTRELLGELAPALIDGSLAAQESPAGKRIQAANRNREYQRFLDKRGG